MLKLDIEKFLILFIFIIIYILSYKLEIFHIRKLFCFPRVYSPDLPWGHSRFSPQSSQYSPYSPLPIFPSEVSQGYTKSNTLSKNRQMNNKQNYKMWLKIPGTLITPSPTVSWGLERWLTRQERWTLFQRFWVWFPALRSQLTTICHSRFQGLWYLI